MSENKEYDYIFYKHQHDTSFQAARVIVPFIIETLQPKSVIDVGCGTGAWLYWFERYGIQDYVGVDGEYVVRSNLMISEEKFVEHDLTRPLMFDRTFDLAICLEVAEHLPENCAERLVDDLTRLSHQILFSAAIPFQGGTHHIHERWQSYWIDKFHKRDYKEYDIIRPRFWEEEIPWWYIQNSLLFIKEDLTVNIAAGETIKSIVHPKLYLYKQEIIEKLKNIIKIFYKSLRKKIIIFGAGSGIKAVLELMKSLEIPVSYIVDNDPKKKGIQIDGIEVKEPAELLLEDKDCVFIMISSIFAPQIKKQLEEMGFIENVHFASYY